MHLVPVQQCFLDETVPVTKQKEAKNKLQGVKVTFHWCILSLLTVPFPHLFPF